MRIQQPKRIDIFGTKFSDLNFESAIKYLTENNFNEPGYVCFPSTNFISYAYNDKKFQDILNNSLLTVADGKFTEYYCRLKGHNGIKNISGYCLLDRLLKTEFTHFFYGVDDVTLKKLEDVLKHKYPNAKILGYKSPPFVDEKSIYPNEQILTDIKYINSSKPDFIWIGISTPKQDILMHHYHKYLSCGVMLGVGAVFLYHSGALNKGPEILKKLSLRWLYIFLQQPLVVFKRNKMIPGIAGFLKLVIKYDILKTNPEH